MFAGESGRFAPMNSPSRLERDSRLSLPPNVHGVADRNFGWAVRALAAMFPGRRFGGGALAVYLDGQPVVDVWTGWSDRAGRLPWSADTGTMVFSATKGMAATVIHRLVDRGLIDYEAPVARYWPEFAANGKSAITVRQLLRHRAGLSGLGGAGVTELLDHELMEHRLAAAAPKYWSGKPAYHALTFGWLLAGLARAVTGIGMRDLIRRELATPLNVDGLHLGRPPAGASTRVAQIIMPQRTLPNPVFDYLAPKFAASVLGSGFGSLYFPGARAVLQGDMALLDTEAPAVNGVTTARGLARMYGAIANGGEIDGVRFLSGELVAGLAGRGSLRPDRNIGVPMAFHLGYHAVPVPGLMPGFGHVGLGGSVGWADPASGLAFGFVHNRLLTPLVMTDQSGFVGINALIRRGAAQARIRGYRPVANFGAPMPGLGEVAG